MMHSLRRELAVSTGLGLAAIFVIAGWILWSLVREGSRADFDASLTAKASALSSLLSYKNGVIDFEFADELMPEFNRPKNPEYFQLWAGKNNVHERSLSLGSMDLPHQTGSINAPYLWNMDLPDGRSGRAVGITVPVDHPDDARGVDHRIHPVSVDLVMAVSRASLDQELGNLMNALWITGLSVVLAGIGLTLLIIGRCSTRLAFLGDQLARIDSESLDTRISTNGLVLELRPLGEALNALLIRVKHGMLREKRMTSNIAHGLRTPVAELRTASDIAQQWPDDPELTSQLVQVASSVSIRMTTTINTLLRLGQLREKGLSLSHTRADLTQMTRNVFEDLSSESDTKECFITHRVDEDVFVSTETPIAEVLFRNLAQNAVSHSPARSQIEVSLLKEHGNIIWTLVNPAPDLQGTDIALLSEPFWRKEASRSSSQHSGLGLSVEVENDDLEVNLTVTLPGDTTVFEIPECFLEANGVEYDLGIGVVTHDGNVTFVETSFVTSN